MKFLIVIRLLLAIFDAVARPVIDNATLVLFVSGSTFTSTDSANLKSS